MARLVYALNQSLDGYVDHTRMGPPHPELFRHFIELTRASSGLLYGRRTYEIMSYWQTDLPDWNADEHAFAAAWRSKPKWVVSRTLHFAGPNATLLDRDFASAIRALKSQLEGELLVAGPNLAATLTDLIDEYRLYVHPVVLGSGQPFFAAARPPLRVTATDQVAGVIRLTCVPA
ncbi:dihydrofolate reductase family protein [Occallatibacter savannae]|uniref:dihydrofolate reductase family protein n=1 Tax=Occallatibacter savannae TaxID=1002691 RepID=UPI000D69BDB7|nr:dihydrofolate reductase family protein [Occallatibacter savannae]